jgi:hypothetical protein
MSRKQLRLFLCTEVEGCMAILNFVGFEYYGVNHLLHPSLQANQNTPDFLEVGIGNNSATVSPYTDTSNGPPVVSNIAAQVSPEGNYSPVLAVGSVYGGGYTFTTLSATQLQNAYGQYGYYGGDDIKEIYTTFWWKTSLLPTIESNATKPIIDVYPNIASFGVRGSGVIFYSYGPSVFLGPSGFIQPDTWYQFKMKFSAYSGGSHSIYVNDEYLGSAPNGIYNNTSKIDAILFTSTTGSTTVDNVILSDEQWYPTALITRPFTPTGVVGSGFRENASYTSDFPYSGWYAGSSGTHALNYLKPVENYMEYLSSGHICDNHFSYFGASGYWPFIKFKYGNNTDNYGDGKVLSAKLQHRILNGTYSSPNHHSWASLYFNDGLTTATNSGFNAGCGTLGARIDIPSHLDYNVSEILPFFVGQFEITGFAPPYGQPTGSQVVGFAESNGRPLISSSFLSFLYLDGNPITISGSITGTPDDGGFTNNGDFWTENNFDIIGNSGSNSYGIFNRFTDIQVPPSADIMSAKLNFKSITNSSGDFANVSIRAALLADAPAPTGHQDVVNLMNDPTIDLIWHQIPHVTSDGWYSSMDITPIVLQLTQLPGWQAGNAMTFFIMDSGSNNDAFRTRYDYASNPNDGATIQITYIDGATSVLNNRIAPILFRNNLFFPGLK